MAGNGDPAEISQVLCLKRIIIVVGWDRCVKQPLAVIFNNYLPSGGGW